MAMRLHYHGLDILRFVAASLVVFGHLSLYSSLQASVVAYENELAFPVLLPFRYIGPIGVEIFFLISGFVITESSKSATAGCFALNRAIRIFPALWICASLALLARTFAGEPFVPLLGSFARSAFLSPVGPYIDGVVWTLVVEAVFYVLVFLILLFRSFDKIEALADCLFWVSGAFVVVMALTLLTSAFDPRIEMLAKLCERFPPKVFLLRYGVFFALGIYLWFGQRSGFHRARIGQCLLLAALCTIEISFDRPNFFHFAISAIVWWIGFLAIVSSCKFERQISRALGRQQRLIETAGRMSYPVYLNHYVFGMVLAPVLFKAGVPGSLGLPMILLAIYLSSFVIMKYPERYLQRWASVRLQRATPKLTSALPVPVSNS